MFACGEQGESRHGSTWKKGLFRDTEVALSQRSDPLFGSHQVDEEGRPLD